MRPEQKAAEGFAAAALHAMLQETGLWTWDGQVCHYWLLDADVGDGNLQKIRDLTEEFAKQASNTRIGLILLIIAVIFQMVNALWPMRWKDFGIDWHGVLLAIGFAVILLTLSHWYSKYLAEQSHNEALEILHYETNQTEKPKS